MIVAPVSKKQGTSALRLEHDAKCYRIARKILMTKLSKYRPLLICKTIALIDSAPFDGTILLRDIYVGMSVTLCRNSVVAINYADGNRYR